MQAFTKKIMIAVLSLFLGIAVIGCNGNETTTQVTPNESKIPNLSNPDGVFLQKGDITLTYSELYNEVKVNDGLNQLLNIVDTDLLADYITAVTPTEIEDRIEKLKYGTNDAEELADFTEKQLADKDTEFEQSMYLLGYTTEALVEEYVRLVCARENYAVSQMTKSENSEEAWYAGATEVAKWYENQYKPEISAIKIRFMSESDAKTVLRSFNLVSKGGELRLYTGTLPIDQVPSSQIDDTNSRLLTDEETLTEFIKIYNFIYSDVKDTIAEDASLEQLLAMEDLKLDYDTLTEANTKLGNFVFNTLGNYDEYVNGDGETLYYTYEPLKYYGSNDTSYYMILNLDKEELEDVSEFDGEEADLLAIIGQDLYDELEQEIIDLNLASSTFVSNMMVDLRNENDFAINDYYLATDYSNIDGDFEISEEGHESILATYAGKEVTADDLLKHCLEYNLPMYTVYALQGKEVADAHYEDVYCVADEECQFVVGLNESEKMEEHRLTLQTLEEQFNGSYYAGYYEFDEYLYLAYGVKSRDEMLDRFYVKSTLQPLFIYDDIRSDNYATISELMDLIQPYYDNYFSLNVEHVLIYLDRDENGAPDDYEEFYTELSAAEQTVYDTKLADFEAAIRTYLAEEENTMTSLVTEYKNAVRDDVTWGEFKAYGFYLLTEVIGDVSYNTVVGQFEQSFEDKLISLYGEYNTEANEFEDFLLDDELTETKYGLHLIKAEKGSHFEKPSAKFAMTYDEENNPEYLPGMVNENDELTFEQLKIYADYRFMTLSSGSGDLEALYGFEKPAIPKTVLSAMETYFEAVMDATYVVGYMNDVIFTGFADYTFTPDPMYISSTKAEVLTSSEIIADMLMYQVYAELDHRTEE